MAQHWRDDAPSSGGLLLADSPALGGAHEAPKATPPGRHFSSAAINQPSYLPRHLSPSARSNSDEFGVHWRNQLGVHARKVPNRYSEPVVDGITHPGGHHWRITAEARFGIDRGQTAPRRKFDRPITPRPMPPHRPAPGGRATPPKARREVRTAPYPIIKPLVPKAAPKPAPDPVVFEPITPPAPTQPIEVIEPATAEMPEVPPKWAFDEAMPYQSRQPGPRPSPAVAVLGAVLVASALVHAHTVGQWQLPFGHRQLAAVTGIAPVSGPPAAAAEIPLSASQEVPSDSNLDPTLVAIEAPTTTVAPTTSAPPPTEAPRKFILPVAGARMTSGFGNRRDPVTRTYRLHAGVDYSTPIGTSIHAAAGGAVTSAGWQSGYGYYTCIDHGGGMSTCYGHQSKILVGVGQKVTQNQVIGLSGNTGQSTGPHVHFEVRVGGKPVNPLQYV